MLIFMIKLMIFFCSSIYFFIKLFKTKNKITFISRQSNKINKDFLLLKNDIELRYKEYEVVVLCKKIENGIINKIKYVFHIFKQMYHIATSKVVVLDTYCIPVSILRHKKNLKVIQMWHALGAFKKFGYSIEDKEEGTSSKLNKAMKMHKNYDYIFTSSEKCIPHFAEAFRYDEKYLKVYPLPRLDLLKDKKYKKDKTKSILNVYPELKQKKNILYAPTFRIEKHSLIDKSQINDTKFIEKLIEQINFDEYNLILKSHPLSNLEIDDERIIHDKKFTTLDMMLISDYVITDYSAIVYEAAFLNKPLFFYAYDMDEYLSKREFYLDYKKDMPGIVTKDPKELITSIEKNIYSLDLVKKFKKENIISSSNYTKKISDFIISIIEDKKIKTIKRIKKV